MTSKEMRLARAKLVNDARTLANNPKATPGDLVRVDMMLASAEDLKTKIDRSEPTESLFEALGQAIESRVRQPGAAFVADPRRDAAIFAEMTREKGNKTLTDSDMFYIADTVARDHRILAATVLGTIGRLSAEDQAHHAASFGPILNAGSTAAPGGGGYTIAPLFEAQLLIALKAFGGVRAAATRQ